MNKKILAVVAFLIVPSASYAENVMSVTVHTTDNGRHPLKQKTKTQHYFKYHEDMRGYFPQTKGVNMKCFPYTLRDSLNDISNYFGKPVIVTSGYRKGDSGMHGKCLAADIKLPDVHPHKVYNYAKTLTYVKGTGYYGSKRHIHIDVRAGQVVSWVN
jgi:uncharacterized protein YcbK (DUF882 family)